MSFKKVPWQVGFFIIVLVLSFGTSTVLAQEKNPKAPRELNINNLKEINDLGFITEDQPEKEEKVNEKEVGLKAENGFFKLKLKGDVVESKFPITFDKTLNQLFVSTPKEERQIRILPDQASKIAKQAGILNQINKIEIIENSKPSTEDEIVFNLSGLKIGRLLGFIPIKNSIEAKIGANSGKVLNINQPLWLKLLSPLVK